MPEFYMIFARNTNKIPEFYMIFARKTFFLNFFFLGGEGNCPPPDQSLKALKEGKIETFSICRRYKDNCYIE